MAAPEVAREAVERVRALYAIERQANRASLRGEQSAPLLAQLRLRLLAWKEQLFGGAK